LIPLHLACWTQEEVKLSFVDILTSDKGPYVNSWNGRGRTPIFGFLDHLECVEMPTDRGADITICSNDGITVLHTASIENRADVLKILMDR
jgi:ankyrin repeat protein